MESTHIDSKMKCLCFQHTKTVKVQSFETLGKVYVIVLFLMLPCSYLCFLYVLTHRINDIFYTLSNKKNSFLFIIQYSSHITFKIKLGV